MPENIFLGLGSNIGDREEHLRKAIEMISDRVGEMISASHIYETEPWGFTSQDSFLNLVVRMSSELQPGVLLKTIQGIETELGRTWGKERYSSRIIDIDILLYNNLIIRKPDLVIPHPLIQERRFVLVPMVELFPDGVHPVLNKTFASLLEDCPDNGDVKLYN